MVLLNHVSKLLVPRREDRFLLAVSGGLDSMALVHIFLHFRQHFQVDFEVAYFHHGPSSEPRQEQYRWAAYEFISHFCDQKNIVFHSNAKGKEAQQLLKEWPMPVENEAEHRDQRYYYLYGLMCDQKFDRLVLAHHRDDLLETRIMRLVRGVGPEGLKAMSEINQTTLRPLLKVSRLELKNYLEKCGGDWLEDPSNQNRQGLRNWLRHEWLPQLERKQPGGRRSLSRSLEHLAEMGARGTELDACFQENSLILTEWLCLDTEDKRLALARYMKSQDLKNYGVSHINEVIKRLDTEKKNHSFQLLGHRWEVDAGRMSVKRPG